MGVDEFCESVETTMKGGLFSIVVLHIVASVKEPIHGYFISKSLTRLTGGVLRIQAGTLYPILRNLENHGLVTHQFARSVRGPKRKIYRITAEGRKAHERIIPEMERLFEAITIVRKEDWVDIAGP
jgi:PadR family transcriptional regulator PadR